MTGIDITIVVTVGILVSAIVTPLAASLASRLGVVDHPGGHRVHRSPTPVLGGLAVAAGSVTAAIVGVTRGTPLGRIGLVIVSAALLLGIVGFLDDRKGLSPKIRLLLEAAAGAVLFSAGTRAGVGPPWLDAFLAIVWTVAVINAFNMIDNHDAICSLTAVAAALGAGVIALMDQAGGVALLAFALAGAGAGFLPANVPPARIFLGDTGSMFIGMIIAGVVVWLPTPSGSVLQRLTVAGLLLFVPLADQTLVVIARVRDGRPVTRAATDHTSHRLRARGWSARAVVVAMAGAQALASLAAIGASAVRGRAAIGTMAALAALSGVAVLMVMLRLPPGPREAA